MNGMIYSTMEGSDIHAMFNIEVYAHIGACIYDSQDTSRMLYLKSDKCSAISVLLYCGTHT